MSDIGIFGPGSDTVFAALGLMILGSVLTAVGALTAIVRAQLGGGPVVREPGVYVALGSLVGVGAAFGLAVYADGASPETGAKLDSWLGGLVVGIALVSALAARAAMRAMRPA